jgi:tRNA threonylcarbamoyladenosine biosynthesis protein TsaE
VAPTFELPTERATRELAQRLAKLVQGGDLLVLSGALGAGKTTFARALCVALGVDARRVTSPTFALVHEFTGALPIAHADLYRLRAAEELRELGLDALRDEGRLLVVEWGEPFVAELGGDALLLGFTLDPRRVSAVGSGERSRKLEHALADLAEKLDAKARAR